VGAYHYLLNPAVVQGTNPLKVRIESAFGDVVGMADIAADHGFFSANFTNHGHNRISVFLRKSQNSKQGSRIRMFLLFG
jgi:hypothetical protein